MGWKRTQRCLGICIVLFYLLITSQNCSPTSSFSTEVFDLKASDNQLTSIEQPTVSEPTPSPTSLPTPAPTLSPEASLGCTLYVAADGSDGNSGKTRNLAFRNLQKSADASNYGDVICVYPGEYTGFSMKQLAAFANENKAIIDGIHAASLKDTIGEGSFVSKKYPNHLRTRMISIEKQKAVIRLKANFVELKRNFTDFEGFEVDGSLNTGYNVGIGAEGSSIRIMNNHVHGIYASQRDIDVGNGGAGIDTYGGGNGSTWYIGSDYEVGGNYVHDIRGPVGVKTNLVHAIYTAIPGTNIHDNTVTDVAGFCFHAWHLVKEVKMENNIGSNCMGIVLGSGDSPCTDEPARCHTRDLLIQGNKLTNTQYGILIEGSFYSYDKIAERVVILNNTRDGKVCSDAGLSPGTSDRCPKR